ncbi:phage tail tube protein [Sphingobium bisphenolivorans]|uniref:phage tail tube protein n=1 Tax=Sphingobium bisphenolivorans TaxID=1335760 RepID=UPI0003B65EAA|nr:phage tail tube protein [Sphingobium bisphenolivorans]
MTTAIETQGTVLAIETATGVFTPIAKINDFSAFSGSASVIDTTSLDSTAKEKLMGLQDFGQVSINFNVIPDDAGQVALEAAKASRALKNFKLTLNDTDSTTYAFSGYVLSKSLSGGVDSKLTGSATIEISGAVTVS